MSLFGKKEKDEIARLKAQMSPDQLLYSDLSKQIAVAQAELDKLKKSLNETQTALAEAKQKIIETDEAILLQDFGFYTPHYNYSTSDEYKEKLKAIRDKQKELVKNDCAVRGNNKWTVNGSSAQGKKMVADMKKLLLRAYNAECDDAVEHVRFNNIEASENKIQTSAEAISKLGRIMDISITNQYVSLKVEELLLMHEYQVKKQEEKEEAREARQRQIEEAKVAKELEEARRKLEKEQNHYQNALQRLDAQIASSSEKDRIVLEEKRKELVSQLEVIDGEMKAVDYRAANQRAGYVYIISNIGAFGENIYKIGMTRRLEPMDRVDELGDASVPFNFDVHAMIFTDDAPRLEAALHNAFSDRKVNFINQRREFFNVSLDEIKRVVKDNYDKTVEFVDIAPAEQYRESLKIRSVNIKNTSMQRVCPNCGTKNTGKFCVQCGTKL